MVPDSPYRAGLNRHTKRLHTGFDYKDSILPKTLSNQMFGTSPLMDGFLARINSTMYSMICSVKQIKIFQNAALDKYEKDIN